MNNSDLETALQYLSETGLLIPYGYPVGMHNEFVYGSHEPAADEETWNFYNWNPPQYSDYESPDVLASAKPTWEELNTALTTGLTLTLKNDLVERIDWICTRRVGLVYHPRAEIYPDKEWHVRLAGGDLTAQDTERVRLIARYNDLKTRINAAMVYQTLLQIEQVIDNDPIWNDASLPSDFPTDP